MLFEMSSIKTCRLLLMTQDLFIDPRSDRVIVNFVILLITYAMLQIIITITFIRNTSYWFWKALIPMDVITIVGMTPLLLIPKAVESDVGPTPDQRFLVVTVVVIVLVAQVSPFITIADC